MPFTIELGAMVGRHAHVNIANYWKHTQGVSINDQKSFMDFIKANSIHNFANSSLWEKSESPEIIAKSEMKEVLSSIKLIKNIINSNNLEMHKK